MHEEGEGEDSDKAAELAQGGCNAVSGGANLYRENLGWVDKRGGVGSELYEKVTEPVDQQERPNEFFDIRDESEQAECNRHHGKPEALNGFAAEFVHGEGSDSVTGRGEDGENAQLGKRPLQETVIASESGENKRA